MKTSLLQNTVVALLAASGTFLAVQDPVAPGAPARTWPPDPATEIVNVQGEENFSKRSRDRVIYTVPEERWLVLTDFRRETTLTNDPELDVVMQLPNKKEIVVLHHKYGTSHSFAAGIGITFPPGSRVILHRNNELSGDLTSLYMLTGYLVPVPGAPDKKSR